ncbi:MAG: MFS transporter [Rubrobacteraceae bacterium]
MVSERNRKWWTVVLMSLAATLVIVDVNGLTVALPTIGRDLGASTTGLQWTINAYLLASATPLVAVGRLADIFGRRRVLLIGMVIFIVASAICGMAQTDWWLISARAVQGLGGATFFAASLSIVSNAVPPVERSKGIGVWAGTTGAGAAVGPFIGGFLTSYLSWRWFFYVNIPVALVIVCLTLILVRESRDETVGRHVDLAGLLTLTGGLTALVVAVQQGGTLGWGSPVIVGCTVVALVLLGLFVVVEPRLREPLVDLGLFRNWSYFGANVASFSQNFGLYTMMFLLTLYLQNVLGYSPMQTGLVFLALSGLFVVGNPLAGWLEGVIGPRIPLAIGMVVGAVSYFMLTRLTPTSGLALVIAALILASVGRSLSFTAATTGGMSVIPEDKAGVASGTLSMVRHIGSVFGIAMAGGFFKALESNKLASLFTGAGSNFSDPDRKEVRGLLSGSEAAEAELTRLAPEVAGQVERIVREAFLYGFDGAMLLCVVVSMVGLLAAFLIDGRVSRAG